MIHSHQTIWLTNIFLEYWYITLTYSGCSHGVSQSYHNAHGTTCPTWQARRIWLILYSNREISIATTTAVAAATAQMMESSGPLKLMIPVSGDDCLDLSHRYLYLKCQVLKDDSSPIETLKTDASQGVDTSLGPVNLLFHYLFRQVDSVMNDTLVATCGDTYLYRTYLTMLLSYGRDAKATWLRRLEGWQMDEDGNYIAQEKNGLICQQRQNIMYASRRLWQRYARSRSHPPNSCAWKRS